MTDDCSCFPVPESQQTRYGNATEPGSAWEYNPECPQHGRSGPETPQENHTAVTTSAEGHGAAQRDLSGQIGAFPDVRLLPDGRVVWYVPHPDIPAGGDEWLTTDGKGRPTWYAERELPKDAQRLIPAKPLLALLPELDQLATEAGSHSEEAEVWVRSSTDRLCARLGSLLGEDATGEVT